MDGEYKWFLDIDGTLADDFGNVNSSNIEMMRRHSSDFVLVSGRNMHGLQSFLDEHTLHVDTIGGNGSFISYRNSVVDRINIFEKKVAKKVFDYLNNTKIPYIIHTISGIILMGWIDYNKASEKLAEYHADREASSYQTWVDGYKSVFSENIEKTLYNYEDFSSINDFISFELFPGIETSSLKYFIENQFPTLMCCKSYLTNLEVLPKGVDKGNGVNEYINLSRYKGKTICVGDNENDLTMLQNADYAFAVKNSCIADDTFNELTQDVLGDWIREIVERLKIKWTK